MYSFVAIACLLSVAVAAPSSLYGDIGLVGSVSVPKYGFNYAVSDPVTGDNKAQSEVRDGGVVKGSYSLTEPDGTIRIVDYTADSIRGFNAVVKRVGTASHPQVWPVKQIAAPVAVAPAPVAVAPVAVAPVSVAPAPFAYSNGPGWNGNGYGPDFLGLNILGLGLDTKHDLGLDRKLDLGGLGMYGKLDLGLADIGLGSIDSGYDGHGWKH